MTSYDAPETRALITDLYLNQGLPPRAIEERLKETGVTISSASLRQYLHRSGLTTKRKDADALVEARLSPAAIAKQRVARATETMERWAEKSEAIVDKALDHAAESTRIRDVAVATNTAAQALRIFQMTHGLPVTPAAGGTTTNFFIGFARGPGSPFSPEAIAARERASAVAAGPAVEVEAAPAP